LATCPAWAGKGTNGQENLSKDLSHSVLDQSKVVDELVIDKAHYRQHPDCRTLVCFVYDPSSG